MIQEQLKFEEANYSKLKQQPGAIPGSETFTNLEDAEGNQLWVITVMRAQVVDYTKVLKKNGFLGVEFHYDMEAYMANTQLRE